LVCLRKKIVSQKSVISPLARMRDTTRVLAQGPAAPRLWPLPGRRVPRMKGMERMCTYRTEAVPRQRQADIPLPGLHNLELHILARLQPDIPAHPKLHSPERPAAPLHRTGSQGGLNAGNVDAPFPDRNAGGTCAPNGHGGEEHAGGAQDEPAHAAFAWRVFSRLFAV
jgi:hypothetical protein